MMGVNNISKENDYYIYKCSNGRRFIFDECDLDFFENTLCTVDERGYVTTNRKKDLISHILLGVGSDVVVDHINGNPFDNRRDNLRVATNVQNHWNYRLSERNTTGYKGIYKDRRIDKYHSRICANGKRYYLGAFGSPEEAAFAYDCAARKLFGEFATLNFPFSNEQGCVAQSREVC